MVGETENKLEKNGIAYRKSQSMGLEWPTYKRVGLTSAAYKILVGDQGRILGAHILSDNASGMIQTFSLAMKNNISVQKLHEQCILSPYPSRDSDLIYMLSPFVPGI
jgi:glutathione reductase (NADPH)